MNKRTIGMLITALIIGAMIVMTVKSNIDMTNSNEGLLTGTMKDTNDEDFGLQEGDTPPDFELTTVAGDLVKLSDYKGKKVILNFWASWCPPCKAEMPHMEKYYKAYKDSKNVEILAVNMTTTERRGMDNIEKFVNAYGLTFPIPLDQDGKVTKAYGVISPPTTYIINTDGTIAHKEIGPIDEEMIEEFINNAK